MASTDRFNYSGVEVPPGGLPFQLLVKIAAANYYTAWRDIGEMADAADTVFDEGEY
ncbi:hypothetical protein UFOVP383_9 [uncultured Caudovirales phage]|jgi:hypothetical protein|uniref:Uncharacterized protein n=1 Tax=uncultured Caudovirales phage TaxID=2100421 RepID=A0A6J7WZJ4_9CAUD|nr:hypothetical protein UFOVP383_9 [uncultured Caudovirales phage]